MTALQLLDDARKLGCRFIVQDGLVKVSHTHRIPPALLSQLRAQKAEILKIVRAETTGISRDQLPWVAIARQILDGEFDRGHTSLLESLAIGLRSVHYPLTVQAQDRLRRLKPDLRFLPKAPKP